MDDRARLKICFLTDRMKLGFGVDLVVDQQARRLAERGYEVVVVVIHADADLPPLPYRLVVLNSLPEPVDFGSEAGMRRALALAGVDADIWLLETPPFYDWAKYLDGPVVAIEYGTPPGYMFSPEIGRHLDAMVEARFTQVYTRLLPFDAIMSISESIHRWLPRRAQAFSSMIHLGADHYPRVARDGAEALRARLGFGHDDCMILWVGRMQLDNDEQPYKGFKELLALMPRVAARLERARFVLAGRVSETDQRRLEGEGLTVLANLPAEDLACALSAADFLINLSLWEGFNLAPLEAQFQGTPVILYDIGPHPEIVRRDETGLLVGTPEEFVEAIVRLANNRDLRTRLAKAARSFAQQFTWARSVEKLEGLISASVARSPSRAEILTLRREAMTTKSKTTREEEREIFHIRDLLALDDAKFVRAARRILLGRDCDEAREARWLDILGSGADKRSILLRMADVAAELHILPEFPGLWVCLAGARIMRVMRRMSGGEPSGAASLAASPDAAEMQAARRNVSPEPSLERNSKGSSVEPGLEWSAGRDFVDNLLRFGRPITSCRWYRQAHPEFVRRGYLELLGREASMPEVAAGVQKLLEGQSRRQALVDLRFSKEGRHRPLHDRDLRRILAADIVERRRLSAAR